MRCMWGKILDKLSYIGEGQKVHLGKAVQNRMTRKEVVKGQIRT